MRNNLKLALVEYKVVFQLLPPILTVLATICYNFREDYLINTNAFCIKVYVIYVFLLILLSIAFILFGYSLHYANTELSTLKKEYNSLKDASEEQIKKSLELEAEYDSLRINFDDFFEEVLSLIFRSLKLGGRERVSVYFIPKDEKIFILLSRFSKNPSLRTKSKNNYSFKEGFIYKAVENGPLTENIQADPDDINAYTEEVQKKCTISPERLSNMEMKSRSYHISTIEDNSGEVIAVVVLESLDKDKLDNVMADDTYANYLIIIKEFTIKHRDRFISNLATEKGF